MRRLAILVLAIMLLATPTLAQVNVSPVKVSQPTDPAQALITLIVDPLFNGTWNGVPETVTRDFYREWLAAKAQDAVTPEQWVRYWRDFAAKMAGRRYWENLWHGRGWTVAIADTALAVTGDTQTWRYTIRARKIGAPPDDTVGFTVYSISESGGWKLLLDNDMLALMTATAPEPAKPAQPTQPTGPSQAAPGR